MRFIAIIMAMGIVNQSNITDYWSRDPVCETPFFPSIMNRDRFLNLISCLHLANNELYVSRGQPGYNPLFKLGTVYSTVLARYPLLFGPNQELSIDEGKVPWRGNLHFKVYHKNKPVKYGLQAYMLCDASTGYCLKFHLYTGKTFRQNILETGHGRTYDLCMHLLKGYFGKGHIMYCDNYYSSPRLFVDLWELGVGALGTVRSNRKGIPASIREKHLPNRGDTFSQHTGQLSITKYLDSKPVFLLSTTLTSEKMYTGKKNPVTQELISKPKMVIAYDKFMGGVDRADQMVSNSRSNIRTMKWWKKVFFHVLSLTVLNSYIAYKHNSIHPMSHSSFRKKLVSQLIESHPLDALVTPVSGRPKTQFLERLTARHFPSKIPNDGKSKSLQCVVCNPAVAQMLASQGLPKKRRPGHETSFKCRQCDVSLCIVPCFELYHTMQDYILAYKRLQAEE
ncbi:piggyBac transposable element-derived protein 4-like [Dreissena polymorpha]|uniref:piggyBac transposable element-derived protein 4-like n=1 Tax=Dreissena polymorpha TaxID=45954 RepID=UPI0022645529|nr:piggyBac transposable element-derived protein 4-like [Dreissena polymorpha]